MAIKLNSAIAASIAAGLFAAACGGSTPPAETVDTSEAPVAAPEAVEPAADDTAAHPADDAAPADADAEHGAEDKDGCKGKNDCKGKGGCKTDQNACKGKNDCKGKGGCKANSPH